MEHKAKLLVVDDESSLRLLLTKELTREGYEVDAAESGAEALVRLREEPYHVVLLDIVMPDMNGVAVLRQMKEEGASAEALMLTGNATVESAIECMKLGAFEYVRKPYALAELLIQIERAIEHRRSKLGIEILKDELWRNGRRGAIIGTSPAIESLRIMAAKVARTNSTALILGESGTGKEVTARAIHALSDRRDMQFVPINCASFSETLLESELFGHERGAFTDAKTQKRGLAEMADGGTLFLDEIGEIPMHFQAKLLRFLETGDIRRVGGTRDIHLDVRILCATNRSLEELIGQRQFREDLYYRLNVLSITVPPLREHQEDIPQLIEAFVAQLGFQKRFDRSAVERLAAYDWPGNVRELKNVIERACIMSSSNVVTARDVGFLQRSSLPETALAQSASEQAPAQPDMPPTLSLQQVEREHIVRVLKYVQGHKGRAADLLKISPKTLYNKIKVYGIKQSYA